MKKATTQNKVRWVKYKVVRSDKQYHRYLKIMHRLRNKNERRHRNEIELLELLTDNWYKMNWMKDDPVEVLKWFIHDKYRMSHFAKDLGVSRSHMSDIMNYMKPLSRKLIQKISANFNTPLDLLARPYTLRTKRVKKPRLSDIEW